MILDQFTTEELALATGGASFGIWVWDLEADNIRWSSKLGDIYGIETSLYPTNAAELLAILPASVGINLKADILASVDQVTGRFEFDHQIDRRDGQVGWVRNCGHVEFDGYGQPIKFCATAIDINEQKITELALQKREEQFRRFSELTSDYIYEVDMTVEPLVPHVAAGSYGRVVGYTSAELAEKGGWISIICPEDIAEGMEVWEQLDAGMPTVHEYRILNAYGETRWLRDHSYPVMVSGELVKIIGGVKDISETKVLQDQLVQALKHEAMAHLVGAVAHDFNNLLYVVSASTEMMSLGKDNIESLQDDVLLACDRAAELTRSLLAFARKDLAQPRTVRLSEAVDETNSMLQRAVGEQIRVCTGYSAGVNDKVDIDPGHLQLVLLNLATNARAAMSGRGELILSISAVGPEEIDIPEMNQRETVVLEVADTGCGISEQNLPLIFDPLFTTKSASEGSGIGLATCWQIIERAGGTIRVKSDVAKGTTFSIYLPAVHTDVFTETESAGRYSVGGKERILVVENDVDVRRVSMRILRSYGYTVSGVHGVQSASRAMADGGYDLLLVDVHLPDGDGFDLINELGKANPDLPVLLVSGYIDDNTRSRIRAGGYTVLPKPFSAAALVRSVRATLDA